MHATLAYEINNPLESLSTLLYLLRQQLQESEDLDLLTQAETQVVRLVEVVRRTLESFRVGAQQLSF